MKNVAFIFVILAIIVEFGFTSNEPSGKRKRGGNEEIEDTAVPVELSSERPINHYYLVGAIFLSESIEFKEDENEKLEIFLSNLIGDPFVKKMLRKYITESEATSYLDLINEMWSVGTRIGIPRELLLNLDGSVQLHEFLKIGVKGDKDGHFVKFLKDLVNERSENDHTKGLYRYLKRNLPDFFKVEGESPQPPIVVGNN